jgi:hypothetical protein
MIIGNLLGQGAIAKTKEGIYGTSSTWIIRINGVEVAAVGVIPQSLLSGRVYIWSIHSAACYQHLVPLLRRSRQVIAEILELYPEIYGLCKGANSWRWIKWLGGKFERKGPNGYDWFRIMKWQHL